MWCFCCLCLSSYSSKCNVWQVGPANRAAIQVNLPWVIKTMTLPCKLIGQMSVRIVSIALVMFLALIPSSLVLALESDSETITITMTTKTVIEIELNPPNWETGIMGPEEEKNTQKDHFTITNNGNCEVDTYIKGEDAVWVDDPDAYKWELSSDGSNGTQKYVLWYEKADESSYTLIKKDENGFGDLFTPNLGPGGDNAKKFGLKLEVPPADYTKDGVGYFHEGGEMKTTITISGVVA